MIAAEDIDAIAKSAEEHGMRIDMPIGDVPGVNKLAYIRDTEMNLVGIIQPPAGM